MDGREPGKNHSKYVSRVGPKAVVVVADAIIVISTIIIAIVAAPIDVV